MQGKILANRQGLTADQGSPDSTPLPDPLPLTNAWSHPKPIRSDLRLRQCPHQSVPKRNRRLTKRARKVHSIPTVELIPDPAPLLLEDAPQRSPPLYIELTPPEDLLILPHHLFRRPLVLEGTGYRLWVHGSRQAGSITIRRSQATRDLTQWLQHSGVRLGCSAYIPQSLGSVCNPNGSCGLQFGALVASCGSQYPDHLPPEWYFQSPGRHEMFVDILHTWADDPSVPPNIQVKIRGTLRWLGQRSDGSLRPLPMLDHQHWFTIADVLAVLTAQGQATMWAQPGTSLPNWQNWMVLEGSSEFGEQLASSYHEH